MVVKLASIKINLILIQYMLKIMNVGLCRLQVYLLLKVFLVVEITLLNSVSSAYVLNIIQTVKAIVTFFVIKGNCQTKLYI